MSKHIENPGFTAPTEHELGQESRTAAVAELVTVGALMLSIIVAVTAVSVGIARADAATSVIDNEGGLFAMALMLGLMFVGMGWLTALTLPGHRQRRPKI